MPGDGIKKLANVFKGSPTYSDLKSIQPTNKGTRDRIRSAMLRVLLSLLPNLTEILLEQYSDDADRLEEALERISKSYSENNFDDPNLALSKLTDV